MGVCASIEVVRRMMQAFLAADADSALGLLDEKVRFDATVRPDGKVWHGREGVRRAMTEWTEAWEGYELRVERYIEASPERVAMLWNERGRARGSGVPQSQPGVTVFTLREGVIVEIAIRLDREETLRRLGIAQADRK